jgi:hypothetical protein
MRQARQRVAAQIRAEGDEESKRTRSDADRRRTVAEPYRQSIGCAGDVPVLEPDSDFFKLLNSELGAAAVPQ